MSIQSKTLQSEYANRFSQNVDYRQKVWKILCDDFFSRYIASGDTLLDLGAGWGEFTRNIRAGKKYTMDLNPDCGERVKGFSEFIMQDCSQAWPIAKESLDLVFTSNFLEHLPGKDQVDKTLEQAFHALKAGGIIICLGPNITYLPGLYWDYWDHFVPITDNSMVEALTLKGFEVERCVPKFLPYTMSGSRNPPLFLIRIYLRLPALWRIFGKQFLVVARKR